MIEVKKVSKIYKPSKGITVEALKEVNFNLPNKGMVFILGRSGSGKSTALHLLGGLDGVSSGEIIIDGKPAKDFSPKEWDAYRSEYIGFVFQEYNLFENFNVSENIALAMNLMGEKEKDSKISEALKSVGMEGYEKRSPKELSGGQKQRIAIARALVKEPKVILLDEPTGALDSETSKEIFQLLKALSANKLVVVVSHERDYATDYGDGIIEFADGRVIYDTVSQLASEELSAEKEKPGQKSKKASVPFRARLRLSWAGLRKHPIRLIFTVVLSVICLALVGITDSFGCYDKNAVIYNSMKGEGINYLGFELASNHYWSKSDRKKFFEENDVISADYVFNRPEGVILYTEIKNSDLVEKAGYSPDIQGLMEADESVFERYGLKLTEGRLPEKVKDGDFEEVVIPNYFYEMFKKFGIEEHTGEMTEQGIPIIKLTAVKDFSDLKDKTIINGSLKIVGVVDTNFDFERYSPYFKNIDDLDKRGDILRGEILTNLSFQLHQVLFVRKGYRQDVLFGGYKGESAIPGGSTIANIAGQRNKIDGWSTYYSDINILYRLNEKTELADDEVYLPVSVLFSRLSEEDIKNQTDQLIDEFARENYHETDFGTAGQYAEYIRSKRADWGEENNYHSGYTMDHFEIEAKKALITPELCSVAKNCEITLEYEPFVSYYKNNFRIAGYYDDTSAEIYGTTMILLNDDSLEKFKVILDWPEYTMMYIPFSGDREKDYNLFDYEIEQTADGLHHLEIRVNGKSLQFSNAQIKAVFKADFVFSSMSKLFLYISIGAAIFSCIMFYSYIQASIAGRKKEIGLLRSMGASKMDVFFVFFGESLLIAIISIVLSVLLFGTGVFVLNQFIRIQILLPLTILQLGIRQIIMIAVLSAGITFIATFFPSYAISRKKPIDVIKDL